MSIKINGIEITANKINGQNVTEETLNGVKVYPMNATQWTAIPNPHIWDLTINRGLQPRVCPTESANLTYLNNNYPASNYEIGYKVAVQSLYSGPLGPASCTTHFFIAE